MKTLIHVWTQSPSNIIVTNLDNRWGIGDMIRGSIAAIQYCEEYGYECIIDISLHPVATLLETKEHKYSSFIQQNKNNVKYIMGDKIHEYIQNELKDKDVVYFFANSGPHIFDKAPSIKVIQSIKTLLTPNSVLADYMDTMTKKLPWTEYNILHYRLGDSEVITEQSTDYTQHINYLQQHIESQQVLISDSIYFKELVGKTPSIFMYDEPVSHLGFHTDINKIKHTVFEFILLNTAKSIKTHSVYGWTSGFVRIANYIYNVPFTKI